MATFSAQDLGFIQLDPSWPLPLKLADVVNLREGRVASGEARPIPVFPQQLLRGGEAATDGGTQRRPEADYDLAETPTSARPDEELPAQKLSHQDKLTLSLLVTSRSHAVSLLQRCSKELVPAQWAATDLPIVMRYVSLLQFLDDNDARDIAYFYWHPSATAAPDARYDAAMMMAATGTCELRVAGTVARIAAAQQTDRPTKDTVQQAEDSRRVAYKFLCSAASRFEEAQRLAALVSQGTSAATTTADAFYPVHTHHYFAALGAIALAQGQEIGFHRAQPHDFMPDSTSLSRALPSDGLRASLAHQCAVLYSRAVECLRQIPRPLPGNGEGSQLGATMVLLDALDRHCRMRSALFMAAAHALTARSLLASDAKSAVAHACQVFTQCDRARGVAKSTSTEGQAKIASHPEMLSNANACIETFAESVASAVQRMNDMVARANPTSADIGEVKLAPPRELARAKPYTPG